MNKVSVKKYIYWGLFIGFVVGSVLTGGPFNFIDFIMVRPIVNILFVIFNLVHDFGLAIIIFTILVKLLMWPLVKRQLNQRKLMLKLQPELTQIKKNCKGNKQLESLQTMDLYKRYNVKPFASILTLIIQLPIFIAIFSAIRVIATPSPIDNLSNRAYGIVSYEGSEIKELENKQQIYLGQIEEYNKAENKTELETPKYDFHPQLFGVINLDVKASDVMNGKFSLSALFILVCAILASVIQYIATKQQMPSGKSERKKSFRDLLNDAKNGKELENSDVNSFATGQMSKMMPIMMFMIMFNLNGALAFYYFLSNAITVAQQRIVLRRVDDEIDDMTDKVVLKELRNIQEAEVVENKKTGTKITRISAKDNKKKRRK
ncbi:membrane protein insertase YidC [Candidatus Saccharibacteria bacterium]|nr:membrane protein insertase YidC [Candidatus Saccharibacteria bacterium]MBQ6313439.1 membrane protein insertase YidC [Candidatus Saccharibacteria bacterium]